MKIITIRKGILLCWVIGLIKDMIFKNEQEDCYFDSLLETPNTTKVVEDCLKRQEIDYYLGVK